MSKNPALMATMIETASSLPELLPVLALTVRHALVVRSSGAWRVPNDL